MNRHRFILAHERAELEQQARQDMLIMVLVIAALVLASVVGHSFLSARVAHGQMPELRTEIRMPSVSK